MILPSTPPRRRFARTSWRRPPRPAPRRRPAPRGRTARPRRSSGPSCAPAAATARSPRGPPRAARASCSPGRLTSAPAGTRHERGLEQQLEHGGACGARGRGGAGGRRRRTCAAPRSWGSRAHSAACAVSSAARPPWPSAVAEPRMPGPGPAMHGVPAERRERRRGGRRAALIASCSPPKAGAGRHVAAQQAAVEQVAHHVGERSRGARRPAVWTKPIRRPGAGACAAAQATHGSWPCSEITATGLRSGSSSSGWSFAPPACSSTGMHRVLERRVVELHHVGALGARAVEAARQVHVHDVEAAAAEAEIHGRPRSPPRRRRPRPGRSGARRRSPGGARRPRPP